MRKRERHTGILAGSKTLSGAVCSVTVLSVSRKARLAADPYIGTAGVQVLRFGDSTVAQGMQALDPITRATIFLA